MNNMQITDKLLLASAYVPYQVSNFDNLYEPDEALCHGTIFPELFLPSLGMEAHYDK